MHAMLIAFADSPSEASASMEFMNTAASASMEFMSTALGGVCIFMGIGFILFTLVNTTMGLFTNRATEKEVIKRIVIAMILSIIPCAGGMALIRRANLGNSDAEPEPTPEPEPEPSADPTSASEPTPPTNTPEEPEVHNGPDITIDSTTAIIIAATIVAIVLITAIIIFIKRYKARKRARDAHMEAIKRDIDYAQKHITTVSAQYAQAHTDPEYILYKPLILSDADCVYEFNDKLMRTRTTLEECEQMLGRGKPADLEFIENTALRDLADSLDREWNDLNRKAEHVGTPILDPSQLRRVETLWSMATNEAATVHERQRAMDKLHDIVVNCRGTLAKEMVDYDAAKKKNHVFPWSKNSKRAAILEQNAEENKQNAQLLDAINRVIINGKKRGIIAPPQHVVQLTAPTQLALTA